MPTSTLTRWDWQQRHARLEGRLLSLTTHSGEAVGSVVTSGSFDVTSSNVASVGTGLAEVNVSTAYPALHEGAVGRTVALKLAPWRTSRFGKHFRRLDWKVRRDDA